MKKSSIILCTLLIVNSTRAQQVDPALQALLTNALDSMQQVVGAQSLSASVQFTNEESWTDAVGQAASSPYAEATSDMVYLFGSIAKTMTAGCILQMADEGLLSLEDSIDEYLGDINNVDPSITIRQLLQHTSGLYDVLSNPAHQSAMLSNPTQIWTAASLIDEFLLEPVSTPGAVWSYCNTNYFLLGMIIESISGQAFYSELRDRFFGPLELNSVAIPAFETLSSPVAHVWLDLDGNGSLEDAHWFYSTYLALNSSAGAAGGYYGTSSDVGRWMRSYVRGDLLSDDMLAQAKNTMAAPGLPSTSYGLGLMRRVFVGEIGFGHGGDLGYSGSSWYFPSRDISITVLCNDGGNNSWSLIPVVRELLKTVQHWQATHIGEGTAFLNEGNVFPNPFIDRLSISTPTNTDGAIRLGIYNAQGQLISYQNVIPIDHQIRVFGLENLPVGMYQLVWQNEEGQTFCVRAMRS